MKNRNNCIIPCGDACHNRCMHIESNFALGKVLRGADGTSIIDVHIDDNNDLYVHLSNGQTLHVGRIMIPEIQNGTGINIDKENNKCIISINPNGLVKKESGISVAPDGSLTTGWVEFHINN